MPKRVPVTLDNDQHAIIAAAAEAVGLTISAYLRMAALERAKRESGSRDTGG